MSKRTNRRRPRVLIPTDFARRLTAERERKNLSMGALAEKVGVDLTTIWRIETGHTRKPSPLLVRAIAAALAA